MTKENTKGTNQTGHFRRCSDCGAPIGQDGGPPDGWQLDDGRTVCQRCAAQDLRWLAATAKGWSKP